MLAGNEGPEASTSDVESSGPGGGGEFLLRSVVIAAFASREFIGDARGDEGRLRI